jgi:hypothetical protein
MVHERPAGDVDERFRHAAGQAAQPGGQAARQERHRYVACVQVHGY